MAPRGSAPFTIAPPGFTLPRELGLGVVRLEIADLERSLAYYQRVIGPAILNRTPGSATLGTPDGNALVELIERKGARPVPRRGRLGLYHFALLLPDRTALGRFIRHAADLGERMGMADHLVSEAVYLTDPDGLGIEVYADRPPQTWRLEDGSIAMASDPLDVEDLIRAAGATPWNGAPAGTRVGHVHLHVGDLGQAAGFYHTALGLEQVVLEFPGALFLSAGGYHHHLGTNTWAAGAPPAIEGDARLFEWTIEVPAASDVAGAAGSLRAAGYEVTREEDGAVAADPWGTRVRVRVRR